MNNNLYGYNSYMPTYMRTQGLGGMGYPPAFPMQ